MSVTIGLIAMPCRFKCMFIDFAAALASGLAWSGKVRRLEFESRAPIAAGKFDMRLHRLLFKWLIEFFYTK